MRYTPFAILLFLGVFFSALTPLEASSGTIGFRHARCKNPERFRQIIYKLLFLLKNGGRSVLVEKISNPMIRGLDPEPHTRFPSVRLHHSASSRPRRRIMPKALAKMQRQMSWASVTLILLVRIRNIHRYRTLYDILRLSRRLEDIRRQLALEVKTNLPARTHRSLGNEL